MLRIVGTIYASEGLNVERVSVFGTVQKWAVLPTFWRMVVPPSSRCRWSNLTKH